MTQETIEQCIETLTNIYGEDVRIAREGQQTLTRVSKVELYPTCQPPETPMLLVFDPAQPKPVPYVQPGQLLANGRSPRSTSVQLVGGESWLQFSLNIPWTEEDGIVRFLAAARQRFTQND
jgi:hypothetical protein